MILVVSIVVNFGLGKLLERDGEKQKIFLFLGLAFNLGLLGYYKYADFFITNIFWLVNVNHAITAIILPIGISFFTFQQIAYLMDVYRGIKGRYTFSEYGLFVSFFPQLIAGPIVHHREMMPQFSTLATANISLRISIGLSLIVFGLFKKVVLADTIAEFSSPVFEMADEGMQITLLPAWIAAVGFSLQIYFDFSGYTDIAIGLGALFGIKLPINFFSPYKAHSIIDFWQRWHISLSRFLKNYLYIPLGGNRHRQFVNILVTMLLGGLWHGAAWTFVLWGGLHGCLIGINHAWRKWGPNPLGSNIAFWPLTMLAITLCWVPFRAETFTGAMAIWTGMIGFNGLILPTSYYDFLPALGITDWLSSIQLSIEPATLRSNIGYVENFSGMKEFLILLLVVFLMPNTMEIFSRYQPFITNERFLTVDVTQHRIITWKPSALWAGATTCAAITVLYKLNDVSEFLYFNF
ncbi:MBOAT family protein [Gammaproteobacteria bacterium]|nr:MBOAT family protein [Gammaproteobacteria bacterium]